MADSTKEDIAAVERALLHAHTLARAVRRIVEHALPDVGDAGSDRVSAVELLVMIERETDEALGLL